MGRRALIRVLDALQTMALGMLTAVRSLFP